MLEVLIRHVPTGRCRRPARRNGRGSISLAGSVTQLMPGLGGPLTYHRLLHLPHHQVPQTLARPLRNRSTHRYHRRSQNPHFESFHISPCPRCPETVAQRQGFDRFEAPQGIRYRERSSGASAAQAERSDDRQGRTIFVARPYSLIDNHHRCRQRLETRHRNPSDG